MKPTKHKFTSLKQLIEFIPPYLVSKLSREHGVDKQSCTFTPFSHVVTLIVNFTKHVGQ